MSEEDFQAAAAKIKGYSGDLSNEQKQKIYGLYKQANNGDNTAAAPWAIQLEAKGKWQGWENEKGKSKEDARKEYIAFVNSIMG